MQKLATYQHTNNQLFKKEINTTIPFTKASKRMKHKKKYNQGSEDLCTGCYKTLNKETKDTDKWIDILCSWIGRINTVKMSKVLKMINLFNMIFIKNLLLFFIEIGKTPPKFVWNHKRPQVLKTTLRKKNKARSITFPDSNYMTRLKHLNNIEPA